MHFFISMNTSLRQKNFKSLFGCKVAFVLKYKILQKKICMQNLTFLGYSVVQGEFFNTIIMFSFLCN